MRSLIRSTIVNILSSVLVVNLYYGVRGTVLSGLLASCLVLIGISPKGNARQVSLSLPCVINNCLPVGRKHDRDSSTKPALLSIF